MSARSKARKRAVDLMYAAELRRVPVSELLAQQPADPPINPYTIELIDGVTGNRPRIDEILGSFAHGWSLDRMPAVDRNVLRLAVFELVFNEDVPDAVAITEAVKLVGDLSTDESPAFVNGVLSSVARERETLRQESTTGPGSGEEESIPD
ncbi:MAG TPA: transcription antitermination factor NusB [Marmoricola sp.]|nr:transcription antitermination factor NusB [Marmoricola sp.]